MGRNIDRGFEAREERQRGNDSRRSSAVDRVRERTRRDLYWNLR